MNSQQFEKFAQARREPLMNYFRKRGVTSSDLEDLVQESLFTYWNRREFANAGKEENFLYGIALNLLRAYRREFKRRESALVRGVSTDRIVAVPEIAGTAPQLIQLQAKEVTKLLRKALSKLSDRQRAVLHSLYFDNETLSETGAKMGRRVQTVHVHHHRALAQLRTLLADVYRDGSLQQYQSRRKIRRPN